MVVVIMVDLNGMFMISVKFYLNFALFFSNAKSSRVFCPLSPISSVLPLPAIPLVYPHLPMRSIRAIRTIIPFHHD